MTDTAEIVRPVLVSQIDPIGARIVMEIPTGNNGYIAQIARGDHVGNLVVSGDEAVVAKARGTLERLVASRLDFALKNKAHPQLIG